MPVTSVVAVFPLLAMLLLGGGVGLPLGLPPLAEDPLLARIAPEECLVYTSWSGTCTPDPKSKNQTEQFLAEPEIQQLFSQIERVILAKIGENAPPQQAAATRDAIRWGKKLLMRPVAAFVSSAGIMPQGPDVHGGLVINAGEDAAELRAALEKYQAALPRPAEKVEIGGVSCYRLTIGPGAPTITWGIKGKYLLVGVGEGSLEGILQRARGSAPAWLTTFRKQLPVERPATVTYINVKKIVQQFAPMGGPQVRTMIDAAGLANVTSLAVVSGLDGEGTLNRMLVGIEGEPAGVFSIASGKPLASQDLAPIPCDANFAVAGRLDLARLMDDLLTITDRVQPQAAKEIEQNLNSLSQQLGVDLRKDVIASLGDVWCAYNSSDEGGLILSGLTAVVRVKDYERLSAAHAKLLAQAKAALGPDSRPSQKKAADPGTAEALELAEEARAAGGQAARLSPRIEHLRFAEQDVYFLSTNGLPFAPAWCLTRKELIVATFPQQVKAYLSHGADFKSLAAAPEVADALKAGEGPIGLCYFDARKVLDYVYPLMCMGLQMASRDLAREGIDLNVSIIPSAPAIYKHLRPGVTVLRRTAGGIEVISRGTVPGSSLGAAAPMAVGLLLPAVSSAREAGRRAQSMNNLKQIGLAMMQYMEAHGTFPPAYIADKKSGKPLLSWRVAILPYLEQQALYEQFHLDEPWDSVYNKKLAETVIAVYRSPASRTKPSMTNYLTVRGKDTVFPGKDGITPASITDGMSNTIMVVEASDAKAVPWAKPDDFAYDEKQPAAGLAGLWPGVFQAAFCDGSVRAISTAIDAETLRRLFNRNDGQPVDMSKF